MKIDIIDADTSAIIASRQDWAILNKLLEWLLHECQYMDKGTIHIEDEELIPAILRWLEAVKKTRSQN